MKSSARRRIEGLGPSAGLPYVYLLHALCEDSKTSPSDHRIFELGNEALAALSPGSALSGIPEVHGWWTDRQARDALIVSVRAELEGPLLLSIPGCPGRCDSVGRILPDLEEILYRYDRPRSAPDHQHLPLLKGNTDREAIAASEAYSREAMEYASSAGLRLAVLPDAELGWSARCYLEERPWRYLEIAGVETHPRRRRRGWGKQLLRLVMAAWGGEVAGFLYLSFSDNEPSRRLAESAGFLPVTRFRKHLID